ncbi:hypothetical protein SFRURICE_005557 [Spodoptera frugiperda]|nr:hypothetical protein SFRURICE_005557 [Spodoptera frugiperda]
MSITISARPKNATSLNIQQVRISCIAHTKFTCELTRIENPNEQQLGRKPARHDHLAWSEDPPLLRELYSLFPKVTIDEQNQRMTSQISCIAHTKFTCELTRIENPNEQQLGRKPARHDHLAWSEDPPFLRELYSLFPKVVTQT